MSLVSFYNSNNDSQIFLKSYILKIVLICLIINEILARHDEISRKC